MATFGERLKILREKINLSQEELGKRFNLSQSTIAYYELDRKLPNTNTLWRIADFFEVSIDYLVGRVGDPRMYSPRSAEELFDKFDFADNKLVEKPMYWNGMELTKDEKIEFLAIARAVYDARIALKGNH